MKVYSDRERALTRSRAATTPSASNNLLTAQALALQRAVGNRATTRILARDDYAAERVNSNLPDAPFELRFNGRWLMMDLLGSTRVWEAASGNPVFKLFPSGAGPGSK